MRQGEIVAGGRRASGRGVGQSGVAAGRVLGRWALAILPYVLVAGLVVAIGWPTLLFPFGADQAIFAAIGQAIGRGGMPYVDAWDQKPPAIYLIYAVAIRGPLGLMANVRAFDLAWTAATVSVLIQLGGRWWSPRAGMIAGLLYGAIYVTTSNYWNMAQPDSFIALPLGLALLLYDLAAARGRWRRWALLIAAGALLGVAFQLRFIAALLIPFFPSVELGQTRRRRWVRLWFERMVALGVGFALVQVALAGYLIAGGALDDYVAATRFASGYTRLGGPYSPRGLTFELWTNTVRYAFLWWALTKLMLTAPAIIGGFFGVFVLKERRVAQMVLFVVLAYAGIAAQAKFFPYHWLYMLPFIALLAGWAWDRAFRLLGRTQGRLGATFAGAVLVLGLAFSTPEALDSGLSYWKGYLRFQSHPEEREYYYDYFGPWNGGPYSYRASRETALYLQQRTAPEESVYVWGYSPLVYLLADRPSASRFIYSFPLMSGWAPPEWQGEFIADLEARRPRYFVVQRNEGARWITGHDIDSGNYIPWFPALQRWLEQGYELETEIEDYVLYRRRE